MHGDFQTPSTSSDLTRDLPRNHGTQLICELSERFSAFKCSAKNSRKSRISEPFDSSVSAFVSNWFDEKDPESVEPP